MVRDVPEVGVSIPDSRDREAHAASSAARAWRLRAYPAAALLALAAVIVLAVTAGLGTGGEEGRLGGDYPAFYAAGQLARDGEWGSLYDQKSQQEAQKGLIDDEGGFLYFAYPPPVAAAYAPLAGLEYRWSYLVHTLLMAAALGGAVALARPLFPLVDRHPTAAYAAALGVYPMLRAVVGGQNTALTLLLIVAAARLEAAARPLASGAVVGLLLYKPQFGVVFLAFLAVRRRWSSLASAGVVAAGLWVVSAALLGATWLGDWWSQASNFADINAEANAANFVSLPGALGHLLGTGGAVLGWALSVPLAAGLVGLWWLDRDADAAPSYALTAAGAVLFLPQPLFYEAGLLSLLAAVTIHRRPGTGRILALAALATWIHPLSRSLGSFVLLLIVLAITVWAGTMLASGADLPPGRAEARSPPARPRRGHLGT